MEQRDTVTVEREVERDDVDIPVAGDAQASQAMTARVHQMPGYDERQGITLSDERVIVRHSKEIGELAAAFAEAELEPGYGDIEKTRTARVNSKKGEGSSYTYTYETLRDVIDATRPHLAKHGITVRQLPFPGGRSVTIRTLVWHKSGQWMYNDLTALIPMPDPQAVGSGISYLRRYALKSILNVAADDEDDDGKRASQTERPAPPAPAARKSEQARAPKQAPEKTQQASQVLQPQPAEPAPTVSGRGKVVEVRQVSPDPNPAWLVKLDSGFQSATKSQDYADSLRHLQESGREVELTSTPSLKDPVKFAPKLNEITPLDE